MVERHVPTVHSNTMYRNLKFSDKKNGARKTKYDSNSPFHRRSTEKQSGSLDAAPNCAVQYRLLETPEAAKTAHNSTICANK